MILWDTAGQDRFRHILSSFYRGANGLGFVFDLTDMESFQSVNRWVQVAQQCGAECRVKMLVGNKADLKHVVSRDAALSLATVIGAQYIETSAKEATNVQQMFTNMAEMWVDKLQEQGVSAEFQRPAVSISAHSVQGYGCLGSDSCSTL
ncbi:ras-related protein Rab-1B-like [Physella acuta]|uniref:ras-related protein Rab-1B-like n=1 Tax=Physella acuta TaxID=109671 RepID=UPI0027DBBF0C|nr:ras-related protein Rab-1B-like [Physella acuta]